MQFELGEIDPDTAYRLMVSTVVPRPIAWVVTQGAGGVNAAPYSFFNVMGVAPPTLAIGIQKHDRRGWKDSARNIRETGEFVVHLVPESLAPAMNLTAADAPEGFNELTLTGLETVPSVHVTPPRIAACPVAFECVTHTLVETGPNQVIVIGRAMTLHIDGRFVRNAERGHVDTAALDLVARGVGAGYFRTRDTFQLERPTWAGLQARGKAPPG